MVATENSLCPLCSQKGKSNRIVHLFYKWQEALYSCEDKMCPYFVTDVEGNPLKFDKVTNKSTYVLDKPPQSTSDDDFAVFLNSLTANYEADTSPNVFSMSKMQDTGIKHTYTDFTPNSQQSSQYESKDNSSELSSFGNNFLDISVLENML